MILVFLGVAAALCALVCLISMCCLIVGGRADDGQSL